MRHLVVLQADFTHRGCRHVPGRHKPPDASHSALVYATSVQLQDTSCCPCGIVIKRTAIQRRTVGSDIYGAMGGYVDDKPLFFTRASLLAVG